MREPTKRICNGRVTSITDGRGQVWTKTYDALGRMATLTTPAGGSGSHTHRIWYDGNGNIYKTQDFKFVSHYYAYDDLNRMTGHGASISTNDETYSWVCCTRLSAFTDALGTASLSYDGLNRLTSFADSNGNNVAYEYDTMGRITKLTPAQGSNWWGGPRRPPPIAGRDARATSTAARTTGTTANPPGAMIPVPFLFSPILLSC